MQHIAAIVVTFNPEGELLLKQFRSLKSQVSTIIYVDNGSNDITTLKSLKQHDNVIIRLNNRNLGVATAQNIGITIAKGLKVTHVLLMDQDSLPAINMVALLYESLCLYPSAGCIAPRTQDSYTGQIAKHGIVISGFRIKHIPLIDQPVKVSSCIASGTLIPMCVIEHVGQMKEFLFIDNVDFEWCLRAKYYGYDTFIEPTAILYHRLGNGTKDKILSHSPQREYYIIRNNIYLSRLNYIPLGYRVRKVALAFARIFTSLRCLHLDYFTHGIKGIADGFCCNLNN